MPTKSRYFSVLILDSFFVFRDEENRMRERWGEKGRGGRGGGRERWPTTLAVHPALSRPRERERREGGRERGRDLTHSDMLYY